MGDDASLDEFLVEEAGDEAGSGDEQPGETAADGPPSEPVEPATTTYEFAPDGAVCESCGASVERRWHQNAELVCGECKDW